MRWLAFVLLVGCAAWQVSKQQVVNAREVHVEGMESLLAASGDPKALAGVFATPFVFGGAWFEDTKCRIAFASAGTIEKQHVETFAKCLATVKLVKSDRKNPYPDIGVVTYAPGIELEVLFVRTSDGVRVKWIGYVSRREVKDALPTVTQASLEALRTEPPAELDQATRAKLESELPSRPQLKGHHAWLKLCVDANGAVATITPRSATSITARDAFVANAQGWKLKPFVLGGQPTPVCSLVYLEHPPGTSKGISFPPPLPDKFSAAFVVSPTALSKRTAGEEHIRPDDDDKTTIQHSGVTKIVGSYLFCLDSTGKPTLTHMLRSSGVPNYDQKILNHMMAWRYEPMDTGGLVACSVVTFIYSQR